MRRSTSRSMMEFLFCGCLKCITDRFACFTTLNKKNYEVEKSRTEDWQDSKVVSNEPKLNPSNPIQPTELYCRSISQDVSNDRGREFRRLSSQLSRPGDSADCSTGESGYDTFERPTNPNTSDETMNEWMDSTTTANSKSPTRKMSKFFDWATRLVPSKKFECAHGSKTSSPVATHHARQGCYFVNPMAQLTGEEDSLPGSHLRLNQIDPQKFRDDFHSTGDDFSDQVSIIPQQTDHFSSTLTFDLIDPVYSKIQNSTDGDLDLDPDAHWCQLCWRRNSWTSSSGIHLSADPSSHIYFQPCNHTARIPAPCRLPDIQQETSHSLWSIQPLGESPVKRGTSVDTTTSHINVPDVPARLYGRSTLNLVDRLRHLLNPKSTSRATHSKSALTDSQRMEDTNSFPDKADLRDFRENPDFSRPDARMIDRFDHHVTDLFRPRLLVRKNRKALLRCNNPITKPNVLRAMDHLGEEPKYNSGGSSNSIWDKQEPTFGNSRGSNLSLHQEDVNKQFLGTSERIRVKTHSSTGHLVLDESGNELRHIDSEVDIMEVPYYRSGKPSIQYFPAITQQKVVSPTVNFPTCLRASTYRPLPNLDLMSPLMERSIEDEDARLVLMVH